MSITLRSAELFDVPLVFRRPMQTALSTLTVRRTTILRLTDSEGRIGYGEGVAFDTPWYTSETQHSLQGIAPLLYRLLEQPLHHPADVTDRFRIVQGNPMAKAMFEGAIYELFAAATGQSLATYLGGDESSLVPCGKALGRASAAQTVEAVGQAIASGYGRIKLKLAPTDTVVLEQVRAAFPDAPLMFDANGSFTEADFPLLQQWDSFGLVMMEQPLAASDWSGHQRLARLLQTPICLDESIVAPVDAELMQTLHAGQILNIKPARVGGLTNALSLRTKAPYWLGGMFESGIGRRQTLAFATLPGLAYPIDMASTADYFEEDLLETPYHVEHGHIRYSAPAVSESQLNKLATSRISL